jgi:hypothetical protein
MDFPTTNQSDIASIISDEAIKSGVKYLVNNALDHLKDTFSKTTPASPSAAAARSKIENYQLQRASGLTQFAALALGNRKVHLSQVYIPLTILSSDPGTQAESGPWRVSDWPATLFNGTARILIRDRAGMGKSTLLKYLYLVCLSRRIGPAIFLELRGLRSLADLEDELICEVGRFDHKSMDIDFNADTTKGKWIIFLDGFDEVPKERKGIVVDQIQRFSDKNPKISIVVSSRDDDVLLGLRGFSHCSIKPLEKEEAYALLRKYDFELGIAESLIADIEKQNQGMISQFLENPLLVTLLYKAYSYKTTIPFKKSTFYRQVYDALYESHDLSKGEGYVHVKASGLNLDDFHRALRFLGKLTFPDGVKEYEKDEILAIIEQLAKSSILPSFAATDFLDDITSIVPIFIKDGSIYRWTHKSLQDYFMACFVNSELSSDKQLEVLSKWSDGAKVAANENVIDVLYDLNKDCVEFSIVLPIAQKFSDFVIKTNTRSDLISRESYYERQQLLFCRRIFVGVYPSGVFHAGPKRSTGAADIKKMLKDVEKYANPRSIGQMMRFGEFSEGKEHQSSVVVVEVLEPDFHLFQIAFKLASQRQPGLFLKSDTRYHAFTVAPDWIPRNDLLEVDLDLRRSHNKDPKDFAWINNLVSTPIKVISLSSLGEFIHDVTVLAHQRISGKGLFEDVW